MDENELFDYGYGSILVESETELDYRNAVLIGEVTSGEDGNLSINGCKMSIFELMYANGARFAGIYPDTCEPSHKKLVPAGFDATRVRKAGKADLKYKGEPVETPVVYIPVFPGTNCDYDTAKAFCKAGAEVGIYDAAGRMVAGCTAAEGRTDIDVSRLATGVYLLRAGDTAVKFIKK